MKRDLKWHISFEFYPPKTTEGIQHLLKVADELAAYAPQFFSVTFGAGGSTREGTRDVVKFLQQRTPISVAPHLACVGVNREDLLDILQQYRQLNINRIVALRGDLPPGQVNVGEFKLARDLIHLIREVMPQCQIIVAAYPECHPQANTLQHDLDNLKRKYHAGATSAITQYFFNVDAYFYFLEACHKQAISLPIIPGIMPIVQLSKLMRFSELCGAEIPRWLRKRLEDYGDDVNSIRAFGLDLLTRVCDQLLAAGAPGLHFYTLNHADLSKEILQRLNLMPLLQAV